MIKKKPIDREFENAQLSLFEPVSEPLPEPLPETPAEPTVLEFIRARFEHGPDMTQDEYKRWIKILVNCSIKRMG